MSETPISLFCEAVISSHLDIENEGFLWALGVVFRAATDVGSFFRADLF